MKSIALILLFFLTCLPGYSGTCTNPRLKLELQQMRDNDQYFCNHHFRATKVLINADSIFVTWDTLSAIHLRRIKQIFDTYGYPDYNMVDTAGVANFWLLVQHQTGDTTFQKDMLRALSVQVKRNLAPKWQYAYLKDKILVVTGHKQIYGTQYFLDDQTGLNKAKPLEDSINVEKLRKEMGMDSLTTYLRFINSYYIDSATGDIFHR